ncbi:type 1 glutamine amidotransferase [Sulfitobacter geojensis]|uniref:type 1 glutamine amidotransferase n=1 Tax=Sulfitobacter geojensis TaxID=1342299 RepID=UPI00046A965D|nr:type 1 glutamine amidotransferase [Sulfitobacter geojensis]KHA52962.1 Glutamine amidotransferase class I-like protein [Sulfitobacter geojensis]NYI28384.1 GMP synthase (glutamine-hydrolyzing) [Sulfitobacter geojensis]
MKIGILITGHPPEELSARGRYDAYFQRLLGDRDFTYQAWSVVDGEMPDSVKDAEGWLITGSRHGAYEPHPWIPPLEEFIRACYAAHIPMIGVCFGHQIIAQAMGGTVEKFDGGWSVGAVDYALEGETVAINAWHQDQVTVKPAQAQVIGSTDFCANAALLYGDTFWTIQPHPEYDHDFIEGLLEHRGKGVVPDPQIDAARAKLDAPLDREKVAARMAAFFKKERA